MISEAEAEALVVVSVSINNIERVINVGNGKNSQYLQTDSLLLHLRRLVMVVEVSKSLVVSVAFNISIDMKQKCQFYNKSGEIHVSDTEC